jgi:UDP-3-O-[3-hydroxymyristoyl] glucosamine N-acyltransferase
MSKSVNRSAIRFTVLELAALLKLPVPHAGGDKLITGFAALGEAREGDLSLFSNPKYRKKLAATRASVVLVPPNWTELPKDVIGLQVENPSSAMDAVIEAFGFEPSQTLLRIHPTAVLERDVQLDLQQISIGAHAVVDEGAELGEGVEIGAGCYVGKGVKIGAGTKLFANVTVHEGCIIGRNVILHSGTVVGADGFGYEFVGGQHRKIKQLGIVQIDDEVEIGANTTVTVHASAARGLARARRSTIKCRSRIMS